MFIFNESVNLGYYRWTLMNL